MKCCRHCRDRKVTRPRGLCHRCFREPAVRDRYPTAPNRKGRRRWFPPVANRRDPPRPPEPTAFGIGSAGRIAVYAERVAAGWGLYHPADNPDSDGGDGGDRSGRPTAGRLRGRVNGVDL